MTEKRKYNCLLTDEGNQGWKPETEWGNTPDYFSFASQPKRHAGRFQLEDMIDIRAMETRDDRFDIGS